MASNSSSLFLSNSILILLYIMDMKRHVIVPFSCYFLKKGVEIINFLNYIYIYIYIYIYGLGEKKTLDKSK
jgi:hypothetical protein